MSLKLYASLSLTFLPGHNGISQDLIPCNFHKTNSLITAKIFLSSLFFPITKRYYLQSYFVKIYKQIE